MLQTAEARDQPGKIAEECKLVSHFASATKTESTLERKLKNLSIKEKINESIPKKNSKRFFFTRFNSARLKLKDVTDLVKQNEVKNIVVVAGAGISTNSGIPDFRTPGTGLYDNLKQYHVPYPEAIFDIDFFSISPKPFFVLAKELYPSGKYRPGCSHYFVRLLHEKGLLLRMYTQNIDGLERLAGIPPEKLVEAHGTFTSASCTSCGKKYDGKQIKDAIFNDEIPYCVHGACSGVVKPDIVFFGEDLPHRFHYYLKDVAQADLILIMGTSLEVYPFAGIIEVARYNVPRILFNMKAVGPFRHSKRPADIFVEGDLNENLEKFVTMIGFQKELQELREENESMANFRTVFQKRKDFLKSDGEQQCTLADFLMFLIAWPRFVAFTEPDSAAASANTNRSVSSNCHTQIPENEANNYKNDSEISERSIQNDDNISPWKDQKGQTRSMHCEKPILRRKSSTTQTRSGNEAPFEIPHSKSLQDLSTKRTALRVSTSDKFRTYRETASSSLSSSESSDDTSNLDKPPEL